MSPDIVSHYNQFLTEHLGLLLSNSQMDKDAFKTSAEEVMSRIDTLRRKKSYTALEQKKLVNITMDIYFKGMEIYLKHANNNVFNISRNPTQIEISIFNILYNTTPMREIDVIGNTDYLERVYSEYLQNEQTVETACKFLLEVRKERFKFNAMQYSKNSSRDT